MDERIVGNQLLSDVIGIDIVILSNDYNEFPGIDGDVLSNQKIVFQIKEEDSDYLAIGVLFALSLMSFTFAAPRGVSENYFLPDEEWNLGYFVKALEFKRKNLCFTSDYVSGRLMKTDITFESGGKVILVTRNRGRGAERWLTHLQGKKHINLVSQK